MVPQWVSLQGVIVQGYRVASGPSRDYPYGTLEKQKPFFKSRGLDLDGYFLGTLNVDIHPRTFQLGKPEITFYNVEWTDLHPPEHFSFSRCRLRYKGMEYEGWIYYPHPETKRRNYQNPSLLEVIAHPIPEIRYGDEVQVFVNPDEVKVGNL